MHLGLWRYLVYLSRNDRQKALKVEKCEVLKRFVKTQATVSSKVSTTLANPTVVATFGLGDESEDDWGLGHMGRQGVQLPAIQAPVGVEQEVELLEVQAPVGVQQEENPEDLEAEEEELADVQEYMELAAVRAPVGVQQVGKAEDPEGVEVFSFNIPEGMRVKEWSPRDRERRCIDDHRGAKGGTPLASEEEEGDQT